MSKALKDWWRLALATSSARVVSLWWPSFGFTWRGRAYEFIGAAEATLYRPQLGGDEFHRTFDTSNDLIGGDIPVHNAGVDASPCSTRYQKARSCTVYGFEPCVLNLGSLTRNISNNNFADQVLIATKALNLPNQIWVGS